MNSYTTNHRRDEAKEIPTTSFFHSAARCSLLFPVFGILGNGAVHACGEYIEQYTGVDEHTSQLIMGTLSAVLIVLGFLFGFIALCGVPRYGARGILVRSLLGTLFNGAILGLVLAIALPTILKVRARELNPSLSAQIDQAVGVIKLEAQQKLSSGKTTQVTTNKDSAAKERELDEFLQKASKEYTGDSKLVLTGASRFLRQAVTLEKDYSEKTTALLHPPVTSLEGVVKREDLQARRTNVMAYFEASKRLKEFVKNSDSLLQEDLKSRNVPDEAVQKAMAGYREQAPLRESLMKIWTTDQRMVAAMLGLLDTLDQNWGKWHLDGGSGRIIFESSDTSKYYDFYISELQSTSVEAKSLQLEVMAKLEN